MTHYPVTQKFKKSAENLGFGAFEKSYIFQKHTKFVMV